MSKPRAFPVSKKNLCGKWISVPAYPFSSVPGTPIFRFPFINFSQESFLLLSEDKADGLSPRQSLSTLPVASRKGVLGCNSFWMAEPLNKLGACLHGTGPEPAIGFQLLTSLILSGCRGWKSEGGGQAGFGVWSNMNMKSKLRKQFYLLTKCDEDKKTLMHTHKSSQWYY